MIEITARLSIALADRYKIERRLGEGGMATVYLAEDLKHKRVVAVKVLKPELSAVLGGERFLNEITVTASLQHPHILQLYDSGKADSFLFYVMPYVEGESLRERLTRERQLPIEDVLTITKAVAAALDYAHKRGVIHRDIKPENILLQDDVPLMADFGIALAVKAAGGERLTETGLSVGTPAYMSPEQVAGERDLDARSDVYSLACVTFEMLAGDPPFIASNAQTVMAKHLTDPAPPITTPRPGVSKAIANALSKALSKTPADRYDSAGAFAKGLTDERTAEDRPHAIVVLPFANRSPDPENEYFSDGLTEEIIADLSSVQALSVISRTSAMRLKGTDKDVKTIGEELGVQYVLEGSVRKAGNDLRITAELIDAENDAQLWSEKYRGTMDDVFDLQERVSREIVGALDVTLTADEDKGLAERPIADARAFELYLKTRLELRRYGSATDQASQLLRQAVDIEGETSPLRALMDWAKSNEVRAGLTGATLPLDEAESQARAILELAPDAPYGYALLGHIAKERWDLPDAVRCWRRALERDPDDTETLFQLGIALNAGGQNAPAREVADQLIARDPLSPLTWMLAGSASWFEGHLERSPGLFERGLELDPENPIGRWLTGYAYAFVNDPVRAAPHAEFLRQHFPGSPYTVQVTALVESLNGEHERALEWLASTDSEALDPHNQFHLAECYAIAGAIDKALDLLDQAVAGGFYPYPYIAEYCPFLEPLRGMPRFAAIADNARRRAQEFAASI